MRHYVIATATVLAGCGTMAENADIPQGFRTQHRPVIEDTSSVQIVESGPSVVQGGRRVAGTSCRHSLMDPPPSEANAVALMKRQAEQLGYNAVHSFEVKNDPLAVARNCWSAKIATGIAFKM